VPTSDAPLSTEELNARYDPMSRDDLIAECERLRTALERIVDDICEQINPTLWATNVALDALGHASTRG